MTLTLALPRAGRRGIPYVDTTRTRAMVDADVGPNGEPILVYNAQDAVGSGTYHFYSTAFSARRRTTPVRIDTEHVMGPNEGPIRVRTIGATIIVAYMAPVADGGAAARVKIRRSVDGGRTWAAPVTPAALNIAGVIPETIAMAKDGGTVYVFWKVLAGGNVFFTSSADGGVNWTAAVDTTLVGPGAKQGGIWRWVGAVRSSAGTWLIAGGDPTTPNGGASSDMAVWRAAALTGPWGAAVNINNVIFAQNHSGGIFRRDGGAELVALFDYQNDFLYRSSSLDDGLTWGAAIVVNSGAPPFNAPFNLDAFAAPLAIPGYGQNVAYSSVYTHTDPIRVSVLFQTPNTADLLGVSI